MSTNVTYGVCRVDLLPKSQLVAVNTKVGSTEQEMGSYNCPADRRMAQYWSSYHRGETTAIRNKHKYNVDTGKYEGDYWTNAWGDSMPLSEYNVFYDANYLTGNRYVEMLKAEQILHNSVRMWAKKFTNTQTKVILHEGKPYNQDGSLNKLTNPYPDIGEEEINESFIKLLNERVETLLVEEKRKARERIEKELEKKQKELSDLGISCEAQMKKINEISIENA